MPPGQLVAGGHGLSVARSRGFRRDAASAAGRYFRALAWPGAGLARAARRRAGTLVPVAAGVFRRGIGIYFALPAEPDLALSSGLFIAALSLRILARSHLLPFLLTSILLCMSAGFLAAKLRTEIVAETMLERHGAYDLEGFVESFDRQTPKRARAVIRLASMKYENAEVAKRPFRVRVNVRGDIDAHARSTVKVARHSRPAARARHARRLRFRAHELLPGHRRFGLLAVEAGGAGAARTAVGHEVRTLARRAQRADRRAHHGVLPGQTGELAAALTVGQTAGLDDSSLDDLRGSGLAHVTSISGLHMSLVAGTVFWFLRWLLALFPSIALRFSVRAIAGGAALVCVTVYLALSGASIAAVRSYLMIAVVFLAILLNRPALSLRNVALVGACSS